MWGAGRQNNLFLIPVKFGAAGGVEIMSRVPVQVVGKYLSLNSQVIRIYSYIYTHLFTARRIGAGVDACAMCKG